MRPDLWSLAWRIAVVALLGWNGWELRQIQRHQYTGPGWTEEERDRLVKLRLEAIEDSLKSIERNTRRDPPPFLPR